MITKPIRILQLNANRQNAVIHALLNSATADDSADIVLLTEPWWGNIGNGTQGPVSETAAGWTPILPATPIKDGQRPRTMAYTRRRDDFTVMLRSDIAKDLDVQVLEVVQATHPSTFLVNIYNNDKKQGRRSATKRLQHLALPMNNPIIITGDWNLHHPLWSRSAGPANDSTEQTADWLATQGFTIKNTKGEPTFFSHAHKTWSTIDLTFTNPAATALDTAQGWHIDNGSSFGSDHLALHWTIDYGAVEVENISGERYNFKDTDPAKWRDAFRDTLFTHTVTLDPLRRKTDTLTTEELDAAAHALTEAMQEASAKAAKVRKPSDRARPWWNQGLHDATKKTADLCAQSLAHVQRWGTQAKAVNATIKKSRNYFKRLYKTARRKWITEMLEQAETPDIWKFTKWGKGTRTYASPAISRGPDCDPAISHADKCDALRDELFQPPPPLENKHHPDLTNLHAEDLTHEDVTHDEVRSSIFDQGADKAPGLSQCPFRTIRWAWEVAPDTIHALMNHCLWTGYHPLAWRKAITVAIPKPGKPDYGNPRAYRLIQLLECMGKVLERIIANRLAYLVTKHNLVPANQFGGRPASSTDDAILTFIHDIEAAHNHDRVTSVLTFDIKGFFDFVNHDRLLSVMHAKRIPLQLVQWTAAFLSNREAAICLDGIRGQMPVQNGIPQGSPASPILSIIYAAELLEIFEQAAREHEDAITSGMRLADDPSPTQLIMYIDDGTIYISSQSLDTNTRILTRAYDTTAKWLRSIGLEPDMVK